MSSVLNVINIVFWGLVTLSVLVFVHEGGHFLAARACGVRVTEFFLGLPSRFQLSHSSKKIGTKFGITPFLLGGYAAICGMEPTDSTCLAPVLACVHRHGRISVEEMAQELSLSEDDVMDACSILLGWASIVPFYDESKGEKPGGSYYPTTYLAPARDAQGNTVFDGKAFDATHASAEGEPWELSCSAEEFLEQERTHTYLGKGFLKRVFMLIAGILVNILCGILLLIAVYSAVGTEYVVNSNIVDTVEAESVAAQAGLQGGDAITALGETEITDWVTLTEAIEDHADGKETTLVYEHNGEKHSAQITIADGGKLGVTAQTEVYRMNVLRSAQIAIGYLTSTASAIGELFVPSKTVEVLDNSTSIVGISVMSAQAVESGLSTYLFFAAMISFSLGLMNLLPIPPLDGGKILIEVIQLVIRREVSLKVQTIVSYVGVGLFLALFVYMLRADIIRFIL